PDAAMFQRKADQKREAELRAGEIVPAGLRMFGGDAVGRDLDAFDLVSYDLFVGDEADQRLDRRLDVPTAGVRLDVAIGDPVRRRRRQGYRACFIGAAEGEGLHKTVARLDHVRRSLDALLRQQGGLQALARRMSRVQALDVAAAVDEGEQPGGARCRDAERIAEM